MKSLGAFMIYHDEYGLSTKSSHIYQTENTSLRNQHSDLTSGTSPPYITHMRATRTTFICLSKAEDYDDTIILNLCIRPSILSLWLWTRRLSRSNSACCF